MTTNDKLFMQTLQRVSRNNAESSVKRSIITSKGLLSDELLETFELNNDTGGYCMDVYVEFEPMFREAPVKDWMIRNE